MLNLLLDYFGLEVFDTTLTLCFFYLFPSIMSTTTPTHAIPPTEDIIVYPSTNLLKTKLTEFQYVLAVVVAFESTIIDDVSSTKRRGRMAHVVLRNEEHDIASQINVLLEGIDPRKRICFYLLLVVVLLFLHSAALTEGLNNSKSAST